MRYTFKIDGILVNPKLPNDFDIASNDERNKDKSRRWWNKPYIVIGELEQESWEEHCYRLKEEHNWSDEQIGSKEEWEKEQSKKEIHGIKIILLDLNMM